ncbi:uncharacterized protein LOC18445318 isoform X1 [Amborella trichopoda]|nr:uncharacterized protein LOC18445318 isoform X1 [Amborella trichopoda]|eukprot:XP_006855519.2 uncharacterized protein LOC18445318 isoform X1 [Amborella trichopoda]
MLELFTRNPLLKKPLFFADTRRELSINGVGDELKMMGFEETRVSLVQHASMENGGLDSQDMNSGGDGMKATGSRLGFLSEGASNDSLQGNSNCNVKDEIRVPLNSESKDDPVKEGIRVPFASGTISYSVEEENRVSLDSRADSCSLKEEERAHLISETQSKDKRFKVRGSNSRRDAVKNGNSKLGFSSSDEKSELTSQVGPGHPSSYSSLPDTTKHSTNQTTVSSGPNKSQDESCGPPCTDTNTENYEQRSMDSGLGTHSKGEETNLGSPSVDYSDPGGDTLKVDFSTQVGFGGLSYQHSSSNIDSYIADDNFRVPISINDSEKYSLKRFKLGDMVWGKVKSHPWWPGHIYNEAFASVSVKRNRREGYALVAFFGDSSYGWFDEMELIPFEPNYAEKSHQTSSRAFMKAVEEAVDEVGRRRALGLACRCRRPNNFRPTSVEGYFAVDVEDYEVGGVYSTKQIKDSRDSFQPMEFISFVRSMGVMPRSSEHKTLEGIKNMTTVLAYRKAVFEEFDDTYAQAFGMQPVRPSATDPSKHAEIAPRAPLSGPLVIAEALGEKKSSSKLAKSKDLLKKDKYLFKRRDEPNEHPSITSKESQARQAKLEHAFDFEEDESYAPAASNYIFQKRNPPNDTKAEYKEPRDQDARPSSREVTPEPKTMSIAKETGKVQSVSDKGKGVAHSDSIGEADQAPHSQDGPLTAMESIARLPENHSSVPVNNMTEKSVFPEMNKLNGTSSRVSFAEPTLSLRSEVSESSDSSRAGNFSGNSVAEIFRLEDKKAEAVGPKTSQISTSGAQSKGPSKLYKKISGQSDVSLAVKKVKGLKRVASDMEGGEMKKKKKKVKDSDAKASHEVPRVRKEGEAVLKKPVIQGVALSSTPSDGGPAIELMLSQLLEDLMCLTLDPFHGRERNCATNVRKVFLKFRSLVYQKSLNPVGTEPELPDPHPPKLAGNRASFPESSEPETLKRAKALKTVDKSGNDLAKPSRKRSISDQGQNANSDAARRMKKLKELKSIVQAKQSGQKLPDSTQKAAESSQKMPDSSDRKLESGKAPAILVEPTVLSMKFPEGRGLPSEPQLRATLARFGPLDLSGTRFFRRSGICRVVFRYKKSAQAAYNSAMRSSFFGPGVNYMLKEVQNKPQQATEPQENLADSGKPGFSSERQAVKLKSILKKPAAEEAPGGTPREGPRVKFLLAAEESRGKHSSSAGAISDADVNNNFKPGFGSSSSSPIASSSGSGSGSSSVGSGLLPLPVNVSSFDESVGMSYVGKGYAQYPQQQHAGFRYNEGRDAKMGSEGEERESRGGVDISRQMLNLLMRCSDIVSDVKCALGYVPYHPL